MAPPQQQRTDMLKGALRMLVLKTLALEPRHGVGIADRIKQITRGTFHVGPGSLFPVLHRLEQRFQRVGIVVEQIERHARVPLAAVDLQRREEVGFNRDPTGS